MRNDRGRLTAELRSAKESDGVITIRFNTQDTSAATRILTM